MGWEMILSLLDARKKGSLLASRQKDAADAGLEGVPSLPEVRLLPSRQAIGHRQYRGGL